MAAHPHVYFAGRWVTRDEAHVGIGSLALRYAVSVFEGIRLYAQDGPDPRPRPFLLGEHLSRLAGSMAVMRLADPGIGELPAIISELIDRNQISQDAYVRVAVTPAGPGDLSDEVFPVLSVTAAPMGRKPWLANGTGMSLQVSDWQRAPEQVLSPAAKNISGYAGPRLAWLAARDAGYDGCVLTNSRGRLCEAPTAALFLCAGGVLRTPALTEDVLPSITRAWILRTAPQLGIPATEDLLARADAYQADEAFLCGTGMEFGPIRAFDGKEVEAWPALPVTSALVDRYFAEARGGSSGASSGASRRAAPAGETVRSS